MHFTTLLPLWLLLIGVLLGFVCWKKSLVDQGARSKWLAHGLRLVGILCLILALCRPYWLSESNHLHVVYLVDISESMDPTSIRKAADEIDTATSELKAADRYHVMAFGSGIELSTGEELRKLAEEVEKGTADFDKRNATSLAESMLASRLIMDAEMARRIVVLSDGVPTTSGLDQAINTLKAEGIDIRFRQLAGLKKPEAAVVSLNAATSVAYRGEIVRLSATLRANETMNATARILQRGVAVASIPVQLKADEEQTVRFDVAMNTPGESRWEAEILPERDWFPINNKAATTISVKGQPRILVIHQDERKMRPLARAMAEQGLDLELRGERGLPMTMDKLLAFDAVVLADVPATSLTQRQMELTRRYVSDFGGGLAMLGSENSFGLGGYYRTPIEEALPLTSRYEKEKQKPSLAMVLVIDKSGSMSGQPIQLARASAKAAAELLGAQDQIGVIGFDGAPRTILPMTPATDKATILASIDSLDAGGGTDAFLGMASGYEMLQNAIAKVKHMIVLSDGQTGANDFSGLARTMRAEAMTVSTVALGDGAAKDLMQLIAEDGGGRYYETNDPSNMPQIFTKETMQASRSAIKEDLYSSVVIDDHPMLSGYEEAELPFVLGYIMTQPKPTSQLLIAAETGDPLLAVCKYGLGTGLSWTSDLTERWGSEWLGWGNGASFWAQVLRGIVRKEQSAGLTATGTTRQDQWLIQIERRDELDRPVDNVAWDAKAIDGNGNDVPVSIRQTGVGRYAASINLADHQRVNLRIRDTDHSLMKTLGWQRDYPAEYQLDQAVNPLLAELPLFEPSKAREKIPKTGVYQDISHWFVFAGFGLFIGGIVSRRLA